MITKKDLLNTLQDLYFELDLLGSRVEALEKKNAKITSKKTEKVKRKPGRPRKNN